FLVNVIEHDQFITGAYDTSFLDRTPELFTFAASKDRGTKMLTYVGTVTVNGFPGVENRKKPVYPEPRTPRLSPEQPTLAGTKQILDEKGPEGLVKWIQDQNKVLLTDTTFRDAHQSLLATRIRSYDLIHI